MKLEFHLINEYSITILFFIYINKQVRLLNSEVQVGDGKEKKRLNYFEL
jgi:hypothetical protein